MKKIICLILGLAIVPLAPAESPVPTIHHKLKIILVGDSTVTDKSGWGLGFKQFLDTNQVECINVAAGGRSSMSFMREGRWKRALALKGNYYLIQFGHNNEPGKPGRSTDMATFVRNMEQYVDDARAIGAHPVLVTPLCRRQWDPAHPGKIRSSLEPYAAEDRKIAAEKHVPLIDLHARSLALYEELGPEKCYEFSPLKLVKGKLAHDGTHLAGPGRVMFGRLVVEGLRKAIPELSPFLLTEPRDPMPLLPGDKYNAIVGSDISVNYTNLQEAINAAPDNGTRPYRILVKAGTYPGQLIVPRSKNHIELFGQNLNHTVLTYNLNVRETNAFTNLRFKGTGVIVLGDDFQARPRRSFRTVKFTARMAATSRRPARRRTSLMGLCSSTAGLPATRFPGSPVRTALAKPMPGPWRTWDVPGALTRA